MSTLTVNLKHFYQRRGIWLAHFVVGVVLFTVLVGPVEKPRVDSGQFMGPLLIMFVVGLMASTTMMEVLVRPFSFCLAGHWQIVRKILLVVGGVCSAVAAQVFWLHPHLKGVTLVATIVSAFFAGLICYWAAIALMMGLKNAGAIIGFGVAIVLLGEVLRIPVYVERIIIGQPLIVSSAGLAATVGMWVWFGSRAVSRRHCAKPWLGFFDAFNRDKVARYSKTRSEKLDKAMSKASPWVEEMFIKLMRGSSGSTRTVWACVYGLFGPILSLWKRWIPFVGIIAFAVGYMGKAAWFMFVLIPVMPLMGVRLPVYSTMMIAGSRRERFIATLVNSLALAVLMCGLITAIAGLLAVLAPIVPPITIKEGVVLTLKTIDVRWIVIPLVVMPMAMTVHLLFYRRAIVMMCSMMAIGYMFMVTCFFWEAQVRSVFRPWWTLMVLLAGWLIYLFALRYVCRRRCLVGQ